MSHGTQRAWVAKVRDKYFPLYFKSAWVLEIGSYNVNGTVRDFFMPDCAYMGVDVIEGPGVDLVTPDGYAAWAALHEEERDMYDTVISCEALEHDRQWQETLQAAYAALKPRGLMVLTCAGPGRPEHGTTRTTPSDAPGLPWPTYYKNLSMDDLRGVLSEEMFMECAFDFCVFPADTYFWGVKR